jgi:hypothetical protein
MLLVTAKGGGLYNAAMRRERERRMVSELHPELIKAFQQVFISREDCYPLQRPTGSYVRVRKPLTAEVLAAHLAGTLTIGAYALDQQSQAKWLCLDADTEEQWCDLVKLARQLMEEEVTAYLELSRRGGHLWLFTAAIPAPNIRQFGKQLLVEYGGDAAIELYPKQDQLVTGPGSLVRLPLGIHQKTGKRYHFVSPDGQPIAPTIREQIAVLAQPQRVPQGFIDRLCALAPEPEVYSPTPDFDNLPRGSGSSLSETLKTTVSVHQFVGQFVQLDQANRGLCPFHDDQHQSFQVNVKGNYWNCYAGCGGGSIIDFWMKWREAHGQDSSFAETVKELRQMLL